MTFGAAASEVKLRLQELNVLGIVTVTREDLSPCTAAGGCAGSVLEYGYGHTYKVTFMNVEVSEPVVTITDVTFEGGPVDSASGLGATGEVDNVREFSMDNHAEIDRYGEYMEVAESAESTSNSNDPNYYYDSQADNEWLTPFYVMLFTDRPPDLLDDAIRASIYNVKITTIGSVARVSLPSPTAVSYIRIQREGYGSIALAEVEVYDEKLNWMNDYSRGNPVEASTVMTPYQPVQSFAHAFENVRTQGRWTLEIQQKTDFTPQRDRGGFSYASGTLSDYTIVVTDLAGVVYTYYQDLKAEIVKMPRYGDLSISKAETTSPYANWRESFELSSDGILSVREGGSAPRLPCYGTATSNTNGVAVEGYQYCLERFGVGVLADYAREGGSYPTQNIFLRSERVLFYQPYDGFLGPDFFTYKIHDGVNIQTHGYRNGLETTVNEVTVHVRRCRRYNSDVTNSNSSDTDSYIRYVNPLCGCSSDENNVIGDSGSCNTARDTICSSTTYSNAMIGVRNRFYTMCLACSTSLGYDSADCISETMRAVSLLTVRGLCSSDASMDCTSETITANGVDRWEYLTLKSPGGEEAFTYLGTNLGGAGYYRSAVSA